MFAYISSTLFTKNVFIMLVVSSSRRDLPGSRLDEWFRASSYFFRITIVVLYFSFYRLHLWCLNFTTSCEIANLSMFSKIWTFNMRYLPLPYQGLHLVYSPNIHRWVASQHTSGENYSFLWLPPLTRQLYFGCVLLTEQLWSTVSS